MDRIRQEASLRDIQCNLSRTQEERMLQVATLEQARELTVPFPFSTPPQSHDETGALCFTSRCFRASKCSATMNWCLFSCMR